MIDNSTTEAGDIIIALPSSGVHSNGFSLVRKVFDIDGGALERRPESLGGITLGEALLAPTKIYVKPVLSLIKNGVRISGISHITGGGFYENIPRSIPDGFCAVIGKSAVKVPPLFELIANEGNIPERDMYNTFNMGVGMSITVKRADASRALELLREAGEDAYIIGEIIADDDEKLRFL